MWFSHRFWALQKRTSTSTYRYTQHSSAWQQRSPCYMEHIQRHIYTSIRVCLYIIFIFGSSGPLLFRPFYPSAIESRKKKTAAQTTTTKGVLSNNKIILRKSLSFLSNCRPCAKQMNTTELVKFLWISLLFHSCAIATLLPVPFSLSLYLHWVKRRTRSKKCLRERGKRYDLFTFIYMDLA